MAETRTARKAGNGVHHNGRCTSGRPIGRATGAVTAGDKAQDAADFEAMRSEMIDQIVATIHRQCARLRCLGAYNRLSGLLAEEGGLLAEELDEIELYKAMGGFRSAASTPESGGAEVEAGTDRHRIAQRQPVEVA